MVELNRGQSRTTVRPSGVAPASGLRAQAESMKAMSTAAEAFGTAIAEDAKEERQLFVKTELAKYQTSMMEKQQSLEIQHEGNPEAIGAAMDAYSTERSAALEEIFSDSDQRLLPLALEQTRQSTISVMFKHHGIRRDRQNAEAVEAAKSLEAQVRTTLGAQVDQLGINATPDQIKELVARNSAILKESAVSLGERGLMTPTEIAEVGVKLDKWAFKHWAVGAAAKIGVRQGMDAASQWLEKLDPKDFSYTPEELEALQDAARAEASEQTAGYEEGRSVILQNYIGALGRASTVGEVPPPPAGLDRVRAAQARNAFQNKVDGFADKAVDKSRSTAMTAFEVDLRAAKTPEEAEAIPAPEGLDNYGNELAELKRKDRINGLTDEAEKKTQQAGLIGAIADIEMASSAEELFNTWLFKPENPVDAAQLSAAFAKTLDGFEDGDKKAVIEGFKGRLGVMIETAEARRRAGDDWEAYLPSNELIDRLPFNERAAFYSARDKIKIIGRASDRIDAAKTQTKEDIERLKGTQRNNLGRLLEDLAEGRSDDLTIEDIERYDREKAISPEGSATLKSALRARRAERRDVLDGKAMIGDAMATGNKPTAEQRVNMNKAFKEIFHPTTGTLNPSDPAQRGNIVRVVTAVGYVPDALRKRFMNVQNETAEGLKALIDVYDALSTHDVFNGNVADRHMWQELVTGKNVLAKNETELTEIVRTHREVGGPMQQGVVDGKKIEMRKVTSEMIEETVADTYERRYADQTGMVSDIIRYVTPNTFVSNDMASAPEDARILWEHGGWSVMFGLTSAKGESSLFNYRVTVAPEALAMVKTIADTHQSSSTRVISAPDVVQQAVTDSFKTWGLSTTMDRRGGDAVLTANPPELQYPNQAKQAPMILAHQAQLAISSMVENMTDDQRIQTFGDWRGWSISKVRRAVMDGSIFVAPTTQRGPDGKLLYTMFHRSERGTVQLKKYDENGVELGLRFTATAAIEAQKAVDTDKAERERARAPTFN